MKPFNSKLTLANGVTVSVQASSYHYCDPRSDTGPYTTLEMGFPSVKPPDYIMEHAETPDQPTETVYGYVPVELIQRWFDECGGISSGKLPD